MLRLAGVDGHDRALGPGIFTIVAHPRTSTWVSTRRNGTLYYRLSKLTRPSMPTRRMSTMSDGFGSILCNAPSTIRSV